MKKNVPEKEIEKTIKNKMSELSSSVNCFDKISAKSFTEKNQDFSENGFAVYDLENITGKSKKPLFLKLIATTLAFIICIIAFPETSVFNNLIASLGQSPEKIYSHIIEEIFKETSENTYKIYDMPIENYLKYDTLVTPFYSCPFSDYGKTNINVRIFVRTYNNIPTNQIYAVEYTGEYKKSNFIAVADTKAKFTNDELEKLMVSDESQTDDSIIYSDIQTNLVTSEDSFEENIFSLASFEYNNIFKSDDNIYLYSSKILYYLNEGTYYYDIYNSPDSECKWNNSICFDGFASIQERNKSLFSYKELFTDFESSNDILSYNCITLPESFTENNNSLINQIDFYTFEINGENINTMAVPYDNDVLETLKIYFLQSETISYSESSPEIKITSSNTKYTENISYEQDFDSTESYNYEF